MKPYVCRHLALPAFLFFAPITQAAPLFEDTFDSDTSANWTLKTGYYEGTAADDYTVDWAFDYGKVKYKVYRAADDTEGVEQSIPPAPHSNGTTKGLRVAVNKKDQEAARFAINLFPKGQSFSGDFVLKFDLFLAHSAYLGGGVGTTEYGLFGINHSGEYVNWFALTGANQRDDFKSTAVGRAGSDGLFFGITGDGGAARDAVSLQGGGAGQPPLPKLADGTGGLLDRNGDGVIDTDNGEGFFLNVLPAGKFEGAGYAGKRWMSVEISQVGTTVTWKIDGHIIAQRENDTSFKSGNLMIGYSDPFSSISDPLEETFGLFDNVRVEPVRTVVVDTMDNDSTAGDGKTSLKEALAGLQANDVIRFNIPGAGPHVIKTPIGGYALITAEGVTIDGYSQPGSSPNTLGVLEGNNAKLQIVLDSTGDEAQGDAEKPARRSTRLPYPGYGDSENGILGVVGADNVTIRGLSFASRHTPGSDADPSIYCVAVVQGAENCRVQGCWFGLQPDGKTIKGGGSAVSGFRYRVNVDGSNVDTFSGGLVFGTDSDGRGDIGEGNITAGMHIGLAIELPYARVAGNYFNVLADGKTFLDADDIHQAQLDAGREPGDSSVENIENGRSTDYSVIGTDGNKINDANERNVFGNVKYDHLIEFYSNANNLVIAGNYFGVGIDGTTVAPAVDGMEPDLIELPGTASVRFGTNGDGVSDDLEGNWAFGIQGNDMLLAGANVLVTARGNRFSGNAFDAFPWFDGGARAYETYYASVLETPTSARPTITSLAGNILSGRTPARKIDAWPADFIDVYVIDPLSEAKGNTIPGRYLGTLLDDSEADQVQGAGEFAFDISALNPPPGSKLAVAVTYSKDAKASNVGLSVTGPISEPVLVPGQPATPIQVTGIKTGANNAATLTWTGGTAPFRVQTRSAVGGGAWTDVSTTSERTATVTLTGAAGFYRVAGQ
jgi:hypothetical protein